MCGALPDDRCKPSYIYLVKVAKKTFERSPPMWRIIINRIKQGYRTLPYPKAQPDFPKRFRGRPVLASSAKGMKEIPLNKQNDPLSAVSLDGNLCVDLGRCVFHEEMKAVCPQGILTYSQDYRMAASQREDLLLKDHELKLASSLNERMKRILGRSLKLREVCAGSCNGCDAEIQAMGNVVFDLSRFGIQFVASPRGRPYDHRTGHQEYGTGP